MNLMFQNLILATLHKLSFEHAPTDGLRPPRYDDLDPAVRTYS